MIFSPFRGYDWMGNPMRLSPDGDLLEDDDDVDFAPIPTRHQEGM